MIFSSPTKINLSLKIIRKRSDGFHDIDSDFQFLNWGDKIEISSSMSIVILVPSTSDHDNSIVDRVAEEQL